MYVFCLQLNVTLKSYILAYHYITLNIVFKIIFGGNSFTNSTYLSFWQFPLFSREETLSINFFHKILEPLGCLHYLNPNKRPIVNFNKKLCYGRQIM